MTPLGARLLRQTEATGPIRISDFMALALGDPTDGYYATRDPLGQAGDFTTAPEISQMFGELLGLWAAQVWLDQCGGPVVLAELGPGRGTLMADALRAARSVPGLGEQIEIWLVETSPHLRAAQRDRLGAVNWARSVEDLPQGRPLIVLANEFFDALPIRQFVRAAGGWSERMLGTKDGRLTFAAAPALPDPGLDRRAPAAAPGTVVETCPMGEAVMAHLGARIAATGGAVLAVDYGAWDGTGDTFQAVKSHAATDPLETPGEADLTAHVGFRWLAEAAAPLVPAFTTQGAFLERLGLTPRAETLARTGDAAAITAAHRRLAHPDEMGALFKVLGLRCEETPALPGFAGP